MVETVPALLGAGVRFVARRRRPARAHRRSVAGLRRVLPAARLLLRVAVVGTLLAAGGNGLVTVAEKTSPSALAALLVASTPLWIVAVTAASAATAPARATLAGVALGFAGVALLLLPGNRPHGVGWSPRC